MGKKKNAISDSMPRAFELPLQSTTDDGWTLLRQCWKESTLLANWCIQQMQKVDAGRLPGMTFEECLKGYVPPDLFGNLVGREKEGRGRKDKNKILPVIPRQYPGTEFFIGAKTSANAIIQQVSKKYLADRMDVLWLMKKSFPRYRTFGWPVDPAGWSLTMKPRSNDNKPKDERGWRARCKDGSFRLPWVQELLDENGELPDYCLGRTIDGKNCLNTNASEEEKAKAKECLKPAWLDDSGRPHIVVTLPTGCNRKSGTDDNEDSESSEGGKTILRLRGGPEFARQMAQFRQIVRGDLPRRQVQIRWKPCSESHHRPTCRLNGQPGRVMVKMVADLPVREKPGGRTIVLMTDPNAFWVAWLDGQKAWVLNNDHFVRTTKRYEESLCRIRCIEWRRERLEKPRVVIAHEKHLRQLQRMSQDAKAERRIRGNRDEKQLIRLKKMADKDRRRLDSFTHEVAANLVNFAIRQGVGEIWYLDRDKGFISKFPWFELHLKLKDKCKANGIDLASESDGESSTNNQPDGPNEDGQTNDESPSNPLPASGNGQMIESRSEEDDVWIRVDRLREMAALRVISARKRSGSHPAVTVP